MDPFPLALEFPGHPGAGLRRLEADDWPIELALARTADVPLWTMYPADLDEEGARVRASRNVRAAEDGHGVRYVVEQDGAALGTAGMGRSAEGFELFYALLPEGRGRGLVTAAVSALTGWLREQGEPLVRLSTLDGNAPSEAVAERAGFHRERTGTHVDNRPLTVWLLALNSAAPEE